jgi:uncharacterized protein YggE
MKIAVALVIAGALAAQDTSRTPTIPAVRAQGSATATAKPDQARIDIGVVTQAKTAQAASTANAAQFTEVVNVLKKIAGAGAEIQTVSYSVQPNYRYPKEGGTPTITGYSAVNVVRVVTPLVEKAGEIIDAATGTGANTVRGIEFSVKDERALRAKALGEAARNARANAQAMAAGLGLRVTRILRIEDSAEPPMRPVREMAMMRADAAQTPVEAGTIEVQATVVVTAEVMP